MRALHDFIVNIRVVPAKALEVFAACLKDWILEAATVAALGWILTVDHPVAAWLWGVESRVRFARVASVGLTGVGVVETWSGNVEVGLSVANGVRRWAVVGTLEDNSASARGAWHIGGSSYLEAPATAF